MTGECRPCNRCRRPGCPDCEKWEEQDREQDRERQAAHAAYRRQHPLPTAASLWPDGVAVPPVGTYSVSIPGKAWEDIEEYLAADDTPFDPDSDEEWDRRKVGRGYQVRGVLDGMQVVELVWYLESRSQLDCYYPEEYQIARLCRTTATRLREENPELSEAQRQFDGAYTVRMPW